MTKFAILALSLVLVACAGGGSEEAGCPAIDGREINVVATTPMIGEFVSQVGGENINLTVLMPPEANPHTYEPAPQDAGTIAEADLVFYTGLLYEPAALVKLLENSACSTDILSEVGESVFPIEFKEGGHDDHDDHDDHAGHDHSGTDPHFFTDPVQMVMVVEALVESLIANIDGLDAEAIKANGASYVEELETVNDELQSMFAALSSDQRVLVTNHQVFGYFALQYDFAVVGTVIPSSSTLDSTSAKELAELVEVIKENNVKAIFGDVASSDVLAQTLAAEVGDMKVVPLFTESLGATDTDASTYLGMLRTNGKLISDSLSG